MTTPNQPPVPPAGSGVPQGQGSAFSGQGAAGTVGEEQVPGFDSQGYVGGVGAAGPGFAASAAGVTGVGGTASAAQDAARSEALSSAERELQAAREALQAAERKLAEAQAAAGVPAGQQTYQPVGAQGAGAAPGQFQQPGQAVPAAGQAIPSQAAPGAQAAGASYAQPAYSQPSPGYGQAASGQAVPGTGQAAPGQPAYGQQAYSQPSAGPSQGAYQQPPVQPHYATPLSSRDHVAAGLLAIFLGGFGVHKFYLGYNTQGFILLALSLLGGLFTFGLIAGVVWIISIIEGIIYLTKTQSEFEQLYVYGRREWF